MEFDPAFLSRLQFAWVIGWHILLPAFTVGAAAFIAALEEYNLATEHDVYLRVSMFWIRIFSIAFGMGVVAAVVMPFQLGTNWSRYSNATANVLSPLFAYPRPSPRLRFLDYLAKCYRHADSSQGDAGNSDHGRGARRLDARAVG